MSTNLRNPADRRDYPARWTMRRGKELFREIDERSADGSEELLSVSHITGITPRSQKNVTMFQSESLVGYKICRPGDIAANTMWTWQGAIGVSDYFGVISPSYNVYRQRQDTYNPRYLDFLLREPKLVDVYYSLSTGIRPSRRRLYPDEFLTIRFPVPPRAEQDKIVRFLDEKANAIDEVIATRQKQIDELDELRKTIVNRAVTRGICARELGTVALPTGWKMARLGSLGEFLKGGGISRADLQEDGLPAILYGDIYTKYNIVACDIKNHISPTVAEHAVRIHDGDILMTGSGETKEDIGKTVAFFGSEAYIGGDVILFRQATEDSKYLSYVLNGEEAKAFRYRVAKGDIIVHIYASVLKSFAIPLPPVDEQREIAAYLDEKCAAIDKAIGNRKAAIEELVALKARIVADAVTGRMEVE